MARSSAGLLIFRRDPSDTFQVFLVHPGGPFWVRKDLGAWSIPKGEFESDEDPMNAALREFAEETGFEPPRSSYLPLGSVRQRGGKTVHAWAVEGDLDPARLESGLFSMEWPMHSGHRQEFPEVDRGAWFSAHEAKRHIVPAQAAFIDALERLWAAGEVGLEAP